MYKPGQKQNFLPHSLPLAGAAKHRNYSQALAKLTDIQMDHFCLASFLSARLGSHCIALWKHSGSGGDLDRLLNTVGGGRVDLLASLGNLGEDGLVGQGGDDLGGLVLEGDLVAVDA